LALSKKKDGRGDVEFAPLPFVKDTVECHGLLMSCHG
jgi:hypothetical protein